MTEPLNRRTEVRLTDSEYHSLFEMARLTGTAAQDILREALLASWRPQALLTPKPAPRPPDRK